MATFTGVELYRSEDNLLNRTRAWCDANATLIYSGSLETFADSGLDASTVYFYKIFSVYDDGGSTIYSTGQTLQAITNPIGDPPTLISAVATLI